jgi:hypothetical protein
VILDNGSRNANYISERTARRLMGRRYKQLLRVKTAKGDVSNLEEFMHLRIQIKLRGIRKFDEHLNFFIFPNLASDIIIGRADLVKYKLYGLMQEIDEAELGGSKSESEEEQSDWEVERELELALMEELAEGKEKEDREFYEYVKNMKEELEEMIQSEYADYYSRILKPILAEWAYLWLAKQHLHGIERDDVKNQQGREWLRCLQDRRKR